MQNDLMDAVTRKLDELFSGEYPIYTKNVEQGIETPCFFVGVLKTSDDLLHGSRRQRTWDMRVQFIPEEHTDCAKLLNDVCETLLEGMEWISLPDGRLVHGLKPEGNISDGILTFQISFSRILIRTKEKAETMGTLDMKGTVADEKREIYQRAAPVFKAVSRAAGPSAGAAGRKQDIQPAGNG